MRIVFANQWYPPESGWGGVAMWNHAIAHAYRELGHSVTVIASRLVPDIPALQDDAGITVHRLLVSDAYRWRRLPILGRYVRPVQQLLYAWRVNQTLRTLYRAQSFDVVEFAEVNAEGFFYARNPLTPFVVRCHTPTFVLKRYYTAREMPYDTRIIAWCEKDVIRRAHARTAPSNDLARIIATECRVPLQNIAAIPNALGDEWSERSNPSTIQRSSGCTILHVGRLERVKGVTVLAQAIPLVLRQVPNARFVFVGDDRPTGRGPTQRAELESQFARVGVNSQVEFAGAVDSAALADWYRRADICVVPSMLYESFSYTCAQAMVFGKPVVATRIGGIPETVDDGATGLLVTLGNAAELAEAIVRLAQDADLRERMGRAGQTKAAHAFDAKKIAQANINVYERTIASFEHSPRSR
jgi:glycosyltransferase involved in cell wall biosynthesis